MTGLDVSRKDHDKSIITLIKSVPKSIPFACIALSDVDKIRIIDFPAYEQERLAEVIRSTYAYGIQLEKPIDEKCLQFKLQVKKLLSNKVKKLLPNSIIITKRLFLELPKSLVNSFYSNFTNMHFQKISIPHLTHTMKQNFLH